MATIDSSLVTADIHRLVHISGGVRKIVRTIFERTEDDPSQFEALDYVAPDVVASYPNLTLRKAKVCHQKHDFRLVFAHWTLEDGGEHCDILLVFPRKAGYQIDWDWIVTTLDDL